VAVTHHGLRLELEISKNLIKHKVHAPYLVGLFWANGLAGLHRYFINRLATVEKLNGSEDLAGCAKFVCGGECHVHSEWNMLKLIKLQTINI
jgi:hypothetical protein